MYIAPQLTTDHDTTKGIVKDDQEFDFAAVTNSTLGGLVTNIELGRTVGLLTFIDSVPFYLYAKENGLKELISYYNGVLKLTETKNLIVVVSERFKESKIAQTLKDALGSNFYIGVLNSRDVENSIIISPANAPKLNNFKSLTSLEGTKWTFETKDYTEVLKNFTEGDVLKTINILSVEEYESLPKGVLPTPPSWEGRSLREHLLPIAKELGDVYVKRLEKELSFVEENNFEKIFMIVSDYVEFAKINGIEVGAGRGSVSNSLISFLLGISELDPLEYNLPFERFLNPERITLPDIDIDFESERIDEIKKYIQLTYGENNVCLLRTYNRLTSRAVLRHTARFYNVDDKQTNFISKLIRSTESLREATNRNKTLRDYFLKNKDLAGMCADLENIRRSVSVHPAGIIIDAEDLRYKLPLGEKREGIFVTELEESEVSKHGYLKFDLLSLSNLDFLKTLKEETGVDDKDIPLDDEATYRLFSEGETLGVFQFESKGMIENLQLTSPRSLIELAVSNALYRPGPMQYINQYALHKNTSFSFSKEIDEILKDTHGIIIFQEQFNEIISLLKGVSLGEADNFRRFVSKASESEVKMTFRNLYEECLNMNINNRNFFFSMLYHMKGYSFPKGHALSYALISYRMAYYKTHFPSAFAITYIRQKKDNVEEIIEYAKSKGVKVLPPNVHKGIYTEYTEEHIFLGIEFIKLRDRQKVEELYQQTKKNNWDLERVLLEHCIHLDKVDVEKLIFAGYFDTEKLSNKKSLIQTSDIYYTEVNTHGFTGEEFEYFGITPIVYNEDDYSQEILIQKEYDALGLYTKEKLIDFLAEDIEFTDIDKLQPGTTSTVFGQINKLRIITDKNGRDMVFLELEDNTGTLDVVVFANVLELFRNEMAKGFYVRITGEVNIRKGKVQVIAEEIKRK